MHWYLLVFSDILVGCEMCVSELWRQISRLFPNTVIWEWSRQEDRVGEKFLICRRRGRLLSQSLACTQGLPKVLWKDGMLNILKLVPLLCVYFTLAKAQRMPRLRQGLFCYVLCTPFTPWREVLRGIVVARTSLSNFPYLTEDGLLVRNTAKMRQDETLTDVKI